MNNCIDCANVYTAEDGQKRCVFSGTVIESDTEVPKVCIERNDYQERDTKTKSLFE